MRDKIINNLNEDSLLSDEPKDVSNIISKVIVQKLRHETKIIMEKDGFVDTDNLKTFLSEFVKANFTIENIKKSYLKQKQMSKQRWELKERGDKFYVRVFQGHSKIIGENITDIEEFQELISVPFPVYHGTTIKSTDIILEKGLNPMTRKHVHMASDLWGIRHNSEVILQIDMENAMKNGIEFYKASNGVILSEYIPCEFIKKLDCNEIQTLKKFIKFIDNDDPTIIDQFSADLKKTDHILNTIIEENCKKLKKKIYKNTEHNCYLIFIVGNNDSALMSLGNKYNFPRGLPIFYIPDKQINIYGFYPKFDNDTRNQKIMDSSEFEGDDLNFNFKYSGFLGQIIPFNIGNESFWTTCSKNATNTDFSNDLYRIIKDKMNVEFVEKLCNKKIHFSGETMSKNDQMHGSEILRETLIITSVGNGKWYDLTMDTEKIKEKNYFVDFYSNEEMQKFAIENNLSVDNIYKISENRIKSFMETLDKLRNFIDVKKIMEIISKTADIKIKEGNIKHQEICGNILEGLIIKISRSSKTKTIKYKFPFYTSRTMLLRNYIKDNMNENKICEVITSEFLDNCISYINSWVVNIGEDQKKWSYILLHLYNNFNKYTELYDTHNNVNQHIFVMDKLMDDYHAKKIEYDGDNPIITKKTSIVIPIILSLGPIGVGKSTVSGVIAELMNSEETQKFVHIDGDILDLDIDTVLKLGEERNPYTLWQIYKNLIDNYIPILSTGGGCLFVYGKDEPKFILFDYIEKIFKGQKIEYNINIILPDKETKIINHKNRNTIYEYLNNSTYNISDLFHEYKTKLETIICDRNKRSVETGKNDVINEKSKTKMLNIDNLNIVKGIIESCLTHVKENKGSKINFMFFNKDYSYKQLENQKNYEIFTPILNEINEPNINIPATFKQRRILCDYRKPNDREEMHHITLEYGHDIIVKSEIDEKYKNKNVRGEYIIVFNKNYLDKKNLLIENENPEIKNSIDEMNKICKNNYSLYNNLNEINDIKNIISRIGRGKHLLLPILKEMNVIMGKKPENQVFEIIKLNDINEKYSNHHITVNSGVFSPSQSNDILEKIKDGNTEITLNKTNKDTTEITKTFYYDNVEHIVDVKFLNVFYIPIF